MSTIRRATAEDGAFLQEMLAVAADWQPGARVRPVTEIMAEPSFAHYASGWPQDGDIGFVAEQGGPIGAAWWRYFPASDPGYGFIDETVPEVAIGIVAEARGQGIGTRLLDALVAEARRLSLPALSLSVEPDNPAAALYRRLGFVTVSRPEGSLTMVLKLSPP